MGRSSFNSKQNFLASTSLRPERGDSGISLQDQLLQMRIQSERAKLTKLETELPSPEAMKYMRYEDMPPPSPEQEAEFDREFAQLLSDLFDEDDQNPQFGPEAKQSVQDWLLSLGHKIPDRPEWKTPLYLDE